MFAACFRDRIVHHFLYLLLNPLFEARFVAQGNVSFNCRKGFGTLAAQRAAFDAIRHATDNYRVKAWAYRGDLVSFFMSIDKRILWAKLEPFIRETYKGKYMSILLNITRIVVFHCPEKLCVFNTDTEEWVKHVESPKSLFGNDDYHGMPIGNLTTQIFANFLMSYFDDHVITWMQSYDQPAYYVRFVDDFVIVCRDRTLLKQMVKDLRRYLQAELQIRLHADKYHFQPVSHGMMFVGAYLKNYRMYLSNRTFARFQERVYGFNAMLENKQTVTYADIRRIEQVINSYLGFCKGKRTYARRKQLLLTFGHTFYQYFYIDGHFERVKIKPKAKPQYLAA